MYNVELLKDARKDFIQLVGIKYHTLYVRKTALSLSIMQYMCNRVADEKGIDAITPDVVVKYLNAGTAISDLVAMTDLSEDEDEDGEGTGTSTIDMVGFPQQLLDLACTVSDELPYFNVVKTTTVRDDEDEGEDEDDLISVLCFFREDDTDIPEELKEVGELIKSVRETVSRYCSGLFMTLGNYFEDIQGTQEDKMNSYKFFSETGLGYLFSFLNDRLLTDTGNECVFYKCKEDRPVVEDIAQVISSFDGYTATVEDCEDDPDAVKLTLTVTLEGHEVSAEKTLEEAIAQVNLTDEVQIIISDFVTAKSGLEDAVLVDC